MALSTLDFACEAYGRIRSCSNPPAWLELDTVATGNPDRSCNGSPALTLPDSPSFHHCCCHWATSDHSDHNYWSPLRPDLCPAHRFLRPLPDAHCSTRLWLVCVWERLLQSCHPPPPSPCPVLHTSPAPTSRQAALPKNHSLRSWPLGLRPFLSRPTSAALL